jgi:hypothetical protein
MQFLLDFAQIVALSGFHVAPQKDNPSIHGHPE